MQKSDFFFLCRKLFSKYDEIKGALGATDSSVSKADDSVHIYYLYQ